MSRLPPIEKVADGGGLDPKSRPRIRASAPVLWISRYRRSAARTGCASYGLHLLSTRPSGLGLSINAAHAAGQAGSSGYNAVRR